MNVLIVGASRGIGFELLRQYLADGARVTGTARGEADVERLRGLGARALALDVASADSVSSLAGQLGDEAFDTVVYGAGVYGPRQNALDPPSTADFDAVMHTNVLGPMRVIPQLIRAWAPGARLGLLSSRMGSIGNRSSSGGWLYRASKAAANSVLKDLSLQLAGRAVCVALHPGWVRTDMGGAGADLDVATSAGDLRRLLAGLSADDNGRFLDHDGQPIDW